MHGNTLERFLEHFRLLYAPNYRNGDDGERRDVDGPIRGSSSGRRLPLHTQPAGMYGSRPCL